MSKLFPELDRGITAHILRNGVRVASTDPAANKVVLCLRNLGVIETRERHYVKCTNKDDHDFASRDVLDCEGEIEIGSAEEAYYCPDCGRPVTVTEQKQIFVEVEVTLDPDGIGSYIEAALRTRVLVQEIEQVGPIAFEVQMRDGRNLSVVAPQYAPPRHHSAGLFFAEPTLYITISSIHEPQKTAVEKGQYLGLVDFLCSPATLIEETLIRAAAPLPGRRSLSEVEARFDGMLARHGDRSWQFFEQDFIPRLMLHITENVELVQNYLARLRRLSGTVFAEYYVPIGGAGLPDLRPIDKFAMMNHLFLGNASGDAKCYPKSTLSYQDVVTVNYHLDADPTGATTAVIFVAGDDVASTAWDAMMKLRQQHGTWKIIIIPRYLLLELINALEAIDLLEM